MAGGAHRGAGAGVGHLGRPMSPEIEALQRSTANVLPPPPLPTSAIYGAGGLAAQVAQLGRWFLPVFVPGVLSGLALAALFLA